MSIINRCFYPFLLVTLFGTFGLTQMSFSIIEPLPSNNLCAYETVHGKAKIKSIQLNRPKGESYLGYDEYVVLFEFEPYKKEYAKHAEGRTFRHFVTNRGILTNPGKFYIEKYKLQEGALFQMKMELLKEGHCTPIKFWSPELENDLLDYENANKENRQNDLELQFNAKCLYDTIPGLATVVSIEPDLNPKTLLPYQGYLIKYKFTPNDGTKNLKSADFEWQTFTHYIFKGPKKIMPGSDYIETYKIKQGGFYDMTMYSLKDGEECTSLFTESEHFPHYDYTELFSHNPTEEFIQTACDYDTLLGNIFIMEVRKFLEASQSKYGVDQYLVTYKFVPFQRNIKHPNYSTLENKAIVLMLKGRGKKEFFPGPQYLEKYKIKEGAIYKGKLALLNEGPCRNYKYGIEGIDFFDLEEIFPSKEEEAPQAVAQKAKVQNVISKRNTDDRFRCRYASADGYLRVVNVQKNYLANKDNSTDFPMSVSFIFTPLAMIDDMRVPKMKQYNLVMEQGGYFVHPPESYVNAQGIKGGMNKSVKIYYQVSGTCESFVFVDEETGERWYTDD